MLDLRSLDVLRAVVVHGSFAKAARALSMTPPAVSQRMAALERQADAKLFERSVRGVRLTAAGDTLLEHARTLLAAEETARAEVRAMAQGQRGRLRLGSFPTATAGPVGQALAAIRRTHPLMEVELVDGEPFQLLPRVAAHELDAAVVFHYPGLPAAIGPDGHSTIDEDQFDFVPIGEDPLQAILPCDHPLADGGQIVLADLVDESFIPVAPLVPGFPGLLERMGFMPRFHSVRTDDYRAVLGLVEAGVGIALVPTLALAGEERRRIRVRPLAPPGVIRHLQIAFAAHADRPGLAMEFLSCLPASTTSVVRSDGQPRTPRTHRETR